MIQTVNVEAQDSLQCAEHGVPLWLPPNHLVYHVQTPRRRPEPVPRGVHACPLRYLLENILAQDLFPSSRFPIKPSVQTPTLHPNEQVANRRVWPYQFACDRPCPLAFLVPAAGNQDVRGLARERFFDHGQVFSLLASRRDSSPFGSLTPLRTGAREDIMRARNMYPDRNLSVRCKYPKNLGNK